MCLRKFVIQFAEKEHILLGLIAKGKKVLVGTPEATQVFELLKILAVTLLHRFPPGWETVVKADARGFAIGAILMQSKPQSQKLFPIEFVSRVLSGVEQRYPNTDGELLAAVWAMKQKFRPYLEGAQFQIHTDHKVLCAHQRTSQIHLVPTVWMQKIY
jgi:hypothetical protein